jgi:hypothetical protein
MTFIILFLRSNIRFVLLYKCNSPNVEGNCEDELNCLQQGSTTRKARISMSIELSLVLKVKWLVWCIQHYRCSRNSICGPWWPWLRGWLFVFFALSVTRTISYSVEWNYLIIMNWKGCERRRSWSHLRYHPGICLDQWFSNVFWITAHCKTYNNFLAHFVY